MKKIMISSVAAFAFFAIAGSVSAVSATEIYTPSTGFLKYGSGMGAKVSQMSNVMAAQKALNVCTNSSLVVDGKFGKNTTGVFKTFQASKGIAQDGVIGSITAGKLADCSVGTTGDTSTGSSSTLSGGAGDATITSTSTDVENSAKEDESDVKVLGFQVEADGSDINVSNVKVVFQNDGFAVSSEKMTDYVDSVSVWMGSKEVGSIDASDFTKDSGSPDTFTKTIALKDAVVGEDKKVKFWVAVSAVSNIDSDDLDADWNVSLDTVRYNDATGAILSDMPSLDENFSFDDADTDDNLSIKSSTANPTAATIMVKEDGTSETALIGVFKLDVDEDSSDIKINEIPVVLTINDSANTASSDDNTAIIDEVTIKFNGTEYSSDEDVESITNGDGTATYYFNIDGDETIDAGDDAEIKIYAKFNDQDGNYGVGTTVVASVTGSAIDAEGADDLSATGTFTGKTHTLSVNAPTVSLVGSPTFALSQAIDGVAAGEEDVFLAKFVFNVTAGDEDVYVSNDETDISYTQLGLGSVDSVVLDPEDNTLDDNVTGAYLVTSGSTEKFTLSFYIRGDNASDKITIDSFAYGFSDGAAADDETLDSGLSNFKTSTVYLAK